MVWKLLRCSSVMQICFSRPCEGRPCYDHPTADGLRGPVWCRDEEAGNQILIPHPNTPVENAEEQILDQNPRVLLTKVESLNNSAVQRKISKLKLSYIASDEAQVNLCDLTYMTNKHTCLTYNVDVIGCRPSIPQVSRGSRPASTFRNRMWRRVDHFFWPAKHLSAEPSFEEEGGRLVGVFHLLFSIWSLFKGTSIECWVLSSLCWLTATPILKCKCLCSGRTRPTP